MSRNVNQNHDRNNPSVPDTEYYTLIFTLRLLPSIFDTSAAATIFVTRHVGTYDPFRAAVVGRRLEAQANVQVVLVGPYEGWTRRDALVRLLQEIEVRAKMKLKAVEDAATETLVDPEDELGEEKDEEDDDEDEVEDGEDNGDDDGEHARKGVWMATKIGSKRNKADCDKKGKGKHLPKEEWREVQNKGYDEADDMAETSTPKQKCAQRRAPRRNVPWPNNAEDMSASIIPTRLLRSNRLTKAQQSRDKSKTQAMDMESDELAHSDIDFRAPKIPRTFASSKNGSPMPRRIDDWEEQKLREVKKQDLKKEQKKHKVNQEQTDGEDWEDHGSKRGKRITKRRKSRN